MQPHVQQAECKCFPLPWVHAGKLGMGKFDGFYYELGIAMSRLSSYKDPGSTHIWFIPSNSEEVHLK